MTTVCSDDRLTCTSTKRSDVRYGVEGQNHSPMAVKRECHHRNFSRETYSHQFAKDKHRFTSRCVSEPVTRTSVEVSFCSRNTKSASVFQVKAFGPGLEGGLVGNPAEFTIDTTGAGTGGLGLTVEGPTEAKIECSDNGDGTCSVSYLPTEPGEYLVNILFENVHVPGSPFRADIQMPFDPSKVVASGSGLKRAKVRRRLTLTRSCSRIRRVDEDISPKLKVSWISFCRSERPVL